MWEKYNVFFFTLLNSIVLMELFRARYGAEIKKTNYVAFIVSGSLTTGSIIFFSGPNNADKTLLFVLIYIFLLRIFIKSNIKAGTIAVTFYYIASALGEILAYFILIRHYQLSLTQIRSSFSLTVLTHFLNYVFVILLITYFKIQQKKAPYLALKEDYGNFFITFLLVFLILSVGIFTAIHTSDLTYEQLSSVNLFISASFFIASVAFVIYGTQLFQKRREIEQQQLFIDTMTSMTHDMRRLRHNYRNMLQALSGFAQAEMWPQLTSYIEELVNIDHNVFSDSTVFALQDIKDYGVVGLLINKTNEAHNKNLQVDIITTGIINDFRIKTHHLCEILGIFLDNSIEAASKCETGYVKIVICKNEADISISIINNYVEIVDSNQHTIPRGWGRGTGLHYVQEILNAYDNILWNTKIESNRYEQQLQIITKS